MTQCRWSQIEHLLPGRPGSVGATAADNRLFVEAVLFRYRAGIPWPAGAPRRLEERASPLQPLGQEGRLEANLRASGRGRRQRIRHDRQHHRAMLLVTQLPSI